MRLTNALKQRITNLVEERAIEPKKAILEKSIHAFVLKVFWKQISKAEYQEWQSLSPTFKKYCTTHVGYVRIYDRALGTLAFDSYYDSFKAPAFMDLYLKYENLSADEKEVFKALMKEQDAHEAYVREIHSNLRITLNSCTTVKKLRELWVNGKEIIDKALNESSSPTVHLPMVAIQTLDALVPLP